MASTETFQTQCEHSLLDCTSCSKQVSKKRRVLHVEVVADFHMNSSHVMMLAVWMWRQWKPTKTRRILISLPRSVSYARGLSLIKAKKKEMSLVRVLLFWCFLRAFSGLLNRFSTVVDCFSGDVWQFWALLKHLWGIFFIFSSVLKQILVFGMEPTTLLSSFFVALWVFTWVNRRVDP